MALGSSKDIVPVMRAHPAEWLTSAATAGMFAPLVAGVICLMLDSAAVALAEKFLRARSDAQAGEVSAWAGPQHWTES